MITFLKKILTLFLKNNPILSILWLILTLEFFSSLLKFYLLLYIFAWIKIIFVKDEGIIFLNTFIGTCCFRILVILGAKKTFWFYIDLCCIYLLVFIIGHSLKSIYLSLRFLDLLKHSLITKENFFYHYIKDEFISDEFIFIEFTQTLFFFKKKIYFKNKIFK